MASTGGEADHDLVALLDEALDDFEPFLGADSPAHAAASMSGGDAEVGPAAPPASCPATDGEDDDATRKLAADMAALMVGDGSGNDADEALMRQLEEALAQLEAEVLAADGPPAADTSETPAALDGVEPHLARTLALLARSANTLHEDQSASEVDEAELLRRLGASLDGAVGDDADDLSGAVETVMNQLLAREVMHEPLSQLKVLLGPWVRAHWDELSEADRDRYSKQEACLDAILAAYDAEGDGATQRVMSLMQDMQQHGQPPREIMQQLAPGMDVDRLLDEEGGLRDGACCIA